MKTAVMYGAGNIGRGFIGQIFHDSGYHVIFIDINETVIDALNAQGQYTLRLVDNDGSRDMNIDNVSAVNGRDEQAVAQAIAQCDVMATSVGKGVIPYITANIARGVNLRDGRPLNILICENIPHSPAFLKDLLLPHFDGTLPAHLGLVECTVGRMVPTPDAQSTKGNPTTVIAEPYCILPLDAAAFVGEMPPLSHVQPYDPFLICEEMKLYIHNMGHATCAYLGHLKGYEWLWECAQDSSIEAIARTAMLNCAAAITDCYHGDADTLRNFALELWHRFGNRALGDKVARVGQDPMRKLERNDRLAGAYRRCKAQNIPYEPILQGIAAALCFDHPGDPSAATLQEKLATEGITEFLSNYCNIENEDIPIIESYYQRMKSGDM